MGISRFSHRGATRFFITALAAGAILCLGAASASAIIYRLPNGHYVSFEAISGKKITSNVTRKAPVASRASNLDSVFSNLDYSGGPVMPSNTNYVIVWNPSNYAGNGFETGGPSPLPSVGYVAGVEQFFTDLAAASGASTNSDSVATQYNDAGGNTAAYSSHYGGNLPQDTDALPANGCPAAPGTYCVTDAQIQAELNSFLTAHSLPRGLTNEYFLLTPPDLGSCFDAAGTSCSANASQNQKFCAYHSQSATSAPFLYSNIVYTSVSATNSGGIAGCDPFNPQTPHNGLCANFLFSGGCDYNISMADGTLSAVSHEHNESTTDPEPNNAWTDWGSSVGGENGDKCNGDAGDDPAATFPPGPTTDFARNMSINGHPYFLQREWSNQGHGCLNHLSSLETAPGASFTATGDNSTPLLDHFDASGSGAGIAQYVWQFNDDVKPGDSPQQTTVESTSPTIAHTFPQAGTYTVALTTMTADGRSKGTATQTVSAGLTQAAFAVAGSPVDTSPVAFDASSTSHDAVIGISSYSWNFGDGTTGSGVTTSHRFAPGAHTVTLTVTDTLGRTSAVAHPVTVTDLPPTAAFTAPGGGHAGSPVQFIGSGTDDEATSYRWSFGDGGSAAGAQPTHTFRRAGTYTVTLTVIDLDGVSRSVSHPVSIAAPRCVVPRLQGQTLGAARGALGAAQCRVGTVTQPKHRPHGKPPRHKHWTLVVIRTSPGAGSVKPVGTKVNLVLAYKAMTVRHTRRR